MIQKNKSGGSQWKSGIKVECYENVTAWHRGVIIFKSMPLQSCLQNALIVAFESY